MILLGGPAMPRSYSGDLRERVIEAVELGASRRDAAERLGLYQAARKKDDGEPPASLSELRKQRIRTSRKVLSAKDVATMIATIATMNALRLRPRWVVLGSGCWTDCLGCFGPRSPADCCFWFLPSVPDPASPSGQLRADRSGSLVFLGPRFVVSGSACWIDCSGCFGPTFPADCCS